MTLRPSAFGKANRSAGTTGFRTAASVLLGGLLAASPVAAQDDAVLKWNAATLRAVATGGVAGFAGPRTVAIVHVSIFDAVNGIERRYTPIHVAPDAPRGASVRAAAAQAGYTALAGLFPSQIADFDADLEAILNDIAADAAQENSTSIERGRAWGEHVALEILAWRAADGLNPPDNTFTGGMLPGEWRPTLPLFAPMAGYTMRITEPFVIESPLAFRPLEGPPSMTSQEYTNNFNEVKEFGQDTSATRSADQTLSARWWATGGNAWYQFAVAASRANHLTLSDNARLFALLTVAQADAIISCWDAKVHFNFWRPITAIRLADTDGNPATTLNAAWLPLIATPAYPDYDSGHQSISRSSATVLIAYFGDNFPVEGFNPTLGVTRRWANLSAAADDAFGARIWSGIHFRFAMESARDRAKLIAEYVLANAAQRVHGN
jgi:hypothetical protein